MSVSELDAYVLGVDVGRGHDRSVSTIVLDAETMGGLCEPWRTHDDPTHQLNHWMASRSARRSLSSQSRWWVSGMLAGYAWPTIAITTGPRYYSVWRPANGDDVGTCHASSFDVDDPHAAADLALAGLIAEMLTEAAREHGEPAPVVVFGGVVVSIPESRPAVGWGPWSTVGHATRTRTADEQAEINANLDAHDQAEAAEAERAVKRAKPRPIAYTTAQLEAMPESTRNLVELEHVSLPDWVIACCCAPCDRRREAAEESDDVPF